MSMLAAKNVNRSYASRNRPVTACSECTRRKQKCDRSRPCDKCVTRGAGSHCSYQFEETIHGRQTPNKKRAVRSRKSSSENVVQTAILPRPKLSEHLGYAQGGEDALSALDQLLDENLALAAITCAPSLLDSGRWKEFLRLVAVLPSTEIVQKLVAVFFREANWYFAVLDQYFFDELHMQWIDCERRPSSSGEVSPDVLYFSALLLQVIALALQFLPPGHTCEGILALSTQDQRDAMSERYSEAGQAVISLLDTCQSTVTSVEAHLMRCTWLKNEGRGYESWRSLGSAVRQAQELGLHLKTDLRVDAGDTSGSTLRALWYEERKRRLWVTIFVWESHMSLQLGRPRMINVSDCTLVDPIDCDFPLEPTRTLFRTMDPADRPSSYTLQLVKYRIGLVIHRMMSMGLTNASMQDYSMLHLLQDEVLGMVRNLPEAMQIDSPDTSWDLLYPDLVVSRLQIAIVVCSFLVALHRPHAPVYRPSLQNATDAALRSLAASQELFERSQPHHYKIYTLVFYTIDTGIFLAATAIKFYVEPSETRQKILETLEQCMERLRVLESRNVAAKHGGRVLAKCIQKYRQSWTQSNTTSPNNYHQHDILTGSTLAGSGFDQRVSPVVAMDQSTTMPIMEIGPSLQQDLRNESTNTKVPTAMWLEDMDIMSMLETRFDENDTVWNDFF